MAETKNLKNLVIFFVTFSLLLKSSITMAANHDDDEDYLSLRDLNAAIFTLRSNGYNLFANSIAVSDISFQILSVSVNSSSSSLSSSVNGGFGRHGYTLLAPPNSVLFSLDMSTDAFTYVHSLRFHVIPRRFSYNDLRDVSISSKPYLETLAGGHVIAVASSGDVVSVDGVLVSFPDMYLHSKIAVHGIDGILSSSAARVDDLGFVVAPQPFAGAFSPEISDIPSPEIGVPSPVTSFASFTIGSEFGSVSIPPSEFFSSDYAETPVTSPSPSPECYDLSDCETESLSPYIWPPTSSIPPASSSLPPETPSSARSYDDEEGAEAEEMKKREAEGRDDDDEVLGWRVEDTQNHDYDHLNFAKYKQDHPQNWL
ncbi:hypothetical protein RND81_11G012000 [Saponaria officinalis]|uniref:FAS1 domain-containing protein n=1 Tax=Saponaria officinalis TaxID=3572 RepID=A0AAW1HGY5_SAPOF